MSQFDWAKPASVYAAGVGALWVLFVGVIAALYVTLRLATGAAFSRMDETHRGDQSLFRMEMVPNTLDGEAWMALLEKVS